MTSPFITKSQKSVGIAILLTILFGPLGLLYASVTGAILMILTPVFLFVLLVYGVVQDNSVLMNLSLGILIFLALTYWLICIIWAIMSVSSYNKEIEDENNRQFALWESLQKMDQNQIVINVTKDAIAVNKSGQGTTMSSKPSLREWTKNNPGRSINDYYAKFGS